jgi:hypothetical protein
MKYGVTLTRENFYDLAAHFPFGALSLGEIDSLEDLSFPRFHNAAIVCIANPD